MSTAGIWTMPRIMPSDMLCDIFLMDLFMFI